MHRTRLRIAVEQSESLIPELLVRGRAPTGDFPPMRSLGFVEIDRGEDDYRPLISQLLSPLLDVVIEDEFKTGFMTYGEPVSVGLLLDRLDWCVTSDPTASKQFPDWSQQDELQRLESICQFVESTLKDYHLRLLEVAETEGPVLPELDLPPSDRVPGRLTFFPPYLTVDDHELEVTKENASEVRDWLFDAAYGLGTRLEEQQIHHMIDALHYSDRLCPVSMVKMIP